MASMKATRRKGRGLIGESIGDGRAEVECGFVENDFEVT
jgi:hypothetical protein